MIRTDENALKWVKDYEEANFNWVSSVSYPMAEDYGIDLTLTPVNGEPHKQEVKTCRNQNLKNPDGSWNNYFMIGDSNGMYRNLYWGNVPAKNSTIAALQSINYKCINFTPSMYDLANSNPYLAPTELLGKHIYVVNASALEYSSGNTRIFPSNCKLYQILTNKADLIYLAKDGMLIWDYENLKDAFVGYVWMLCKHTEYFSNSTLSYELKAMLDMDKANYYKADVPDSVFYR